MSKITEYEVASAFDAGDVLLKDGENGTMIISVEDAASEFKRLSGINDDISGINQSVTQAMDTIASNIAGVETDYIASKDYAIGDLFIVNNVLYKATAAIAEEDVIDTEINCAVVNLDDEIGDIRSELANKANVDGSYSTLTAGNAEQLVGTVFTEDDAAYTFRTSGGSADIGDREYDEIVGGSIVLNQLFPVNTVNYNGDNYTITSNSDGIFTITAGEGGATSGDANVTFIRNGFKSNHVYAWLGKTVNIYAVIKGINKQNDTIFKASDSDYNNVSFGFTDLPAGTYKVYPQLFDLTQMFGSEIADYIYNIEQTTPGAGVAWFRKYFPKDYYEYNAGELMHVTDLQSHDMVGFNALTGMALGKERTSINNIINRSNNLAMSKDIINVIPGMTYCLTIPSLTKDTFFYAYTLDEDSRTRIVADGLRITLTSKKVTFTIPDDVHSMAFHIYRGDASPFTEAELEGTCLNLSWDGERDGEYEPYVKHSYPLDSSLTLRGIPKLSTDGKLYYDGDHYKSDGTVERRYGIVDLGTLNWSRSTSYTNPIFYCNFSVRPNGNLLCAKYTSVGMISANAFSVSDDMSIGSSSPDASQLYVRDDSYTNAASFKEAMSGVYLVYELAEPTTEEAQPFQSPQIVDDFGTEEYVTSSIVPVGHITQYDHNLRAKLEMAPNSPDGDGDYLVRQTGSKNKYVPYTDGGRITALESKIPAAPSANGSYILRCTVTDGTATYAWVAE